MKKIFTLAAAVLASVSLWAATESHPTSVPASNADIVGTSYTIPGTHNAGPGGTKAGAMPDKGVKFRLNRAAGDLSNAIKFTVNEGYVINAIQLVGITNSNGKTATVGSIYVDGVAWNGTFNGTLPAKDASAASDIQVSGIAAAQSVVFVFSDLGGATQGNICYTVTYEEAVQKVVDHVDVTLGGVAVNGEALGEPDMATLSSALSLDLTNEYAEAPTVTFTVQTDTYYEGEETPSTKSEDIDVVAALNPDGKWQAQQTVGEQTYTITAVKPATVTVTYMDGETVLGTETVKVGERATKHGEYEVKPLAEFQGWYTNAELTSEADLSAAVGADMVLYAKFEKAYATSLNIEQYVLDNGMHNADKDHIGEAFAAVLNNAHYAYSNINALDTLNDDPSKTNRNYAFLGLKIKNTNGYMACWLQASHTIKIRFGNVGADFKVAVNGVEQTLTAAEYANTSVESANVFSFTADEDALLEIKGSANNKTLVIKQIMIDEEIQAVTLPASPEPTPTGINNAEEAVKAVKRIVNGQLFIEKNGVLFNAQGARL